MPPPNGGPRPRSPGRRRRGPCPGQWLRASEPQWNALSQRCRSALRLEAELERHAAKDQAEQHEDQRQVERRAGPPRRLAETPRTSRRRRAPARSRCRPRSARPSSSSRSRSWSVGRNGNRIPTPRSKPSSSTYIRTPNSDDRGPDQRQVDREFRSRRLFRRLGERTAGGQGTPRASGSGPLGRGLLERLGAAPDQAHHVVDAGRRRSAP